MRARGAGFLLSPNRLNAAASRAQALAIVVESPELLETRCRSVEEMRLVNLLCHLVQYAEGTVSASDSTPDQQPASRNCRRAFRTRRCRPPSYLALLLAAARYRGHIYQYNRSL
jgi:hypothetical protein